MADRDWIAFWAERGKALTTDQQVPGNGFLPPFSIERAESLGLTVDGDEAADGAAAPEVAEAPDADAEAAEEAEDASEGNAEGSDGAPV